MYMFRRWIPALLAMTMTAGTAFCDDAGPAKSYKFEFVIKEVEGTKVLNSRAYSMVTSAGDRSNIRVGSKVPFASKQGTTTEVQQINVGVGIDVHAVKETENRLSFSIGVDVSAVAEDGSVQASPVIRQNTWNSTVTVPLKKPTVVFTSDITDSKRQMQVEVTAIPFP
jgi:Flp pilus assembly secretin CpaC